MLSGNRARKGIACRPLAQLKELIVSPCDVDQKTLARMGYYSNTNLVPRFPREDYNALQPHFYYVRKVESCLQQLKC